MTKLEQIRHSEFECIFSIIEVQIDINNDILNGVRCLNFSDEELAEIKLEQDLLESGLKKLKKMKGKVLFTYDQTRRKVKRTRIQ